MTDVFDVLGHIALGVILVDLVQHADTVNFMSWLALMYAEGRCARCGYKLDHPIVRHETPWWGHYAVA